MTPGPTDPPPARPGEPTEGQAPARLAAVLVNFRTAAETADCARRLATDRPVIDPLVVVDNGSADGSFDRLTDELPDAEVIDAGANRGFAAGANVGIRAALAAGARRVALINPDARLEPGCLAALDRALADPTLGVVGPVVLSARDGTTHSGDGATHSGDETTQSRGITYDRRTGRMRLAGYGQPPPPVTAAPTPVEGVSGCVMLIDRRVFDEVGLLDERYFFGFEDLDLCLRAADRGLGCACVAAARATHRGSGSIGLGSPARCYHAVRGHLRLVRGREPRPLAPAALGRAAFVTGLYLAHAVTQPDVPRAAAVAATVRGLVDHLLGRRGR